MAQRKSDIELEMSRFEEEITKLTPNASQKAQFVISAPPVQSITIKSRMNIQLPATGPFMQTMMANQMMPTYTQTQPAISSSMASNVRYPTTFQTPTISNYRSNESTYIAPSTMMMNSTLKRDSSVLGSSSDIQAKKANTSSSAATAKSSADSANAANANKKKRKYVRLAGGQKWEDETLNEWDTDDFRLFCGDLGNEVNDELLARAFQKYPSFQKARVVRDKRTGKTKGYGFVSFKDSQDFIKAMREMNGKYVGNRPIKLRKSNWKDRNVEVVKKKEAEKAKMGLK